MDKETLIRLLDSLDDDGDVELNHVNADDYLLDFINDEDIKKAYERVYKWYA